jgi:rubrerythrin
MESYRMANTPLWRCPVCGQRFVSRNMPHSCRVVGLDAFFATARR